MLSKDLFEMLRDQLLAVKPTGSDGFEGLVRVCLESLTGVPLRLARAGSQFGRDASSQPMSPLGIAMEAKRYDSPISLEIASKAIVAGEALKGTIDLWIIAATVEIGDDVVVKTAEILEQKGMTLLVLDWANQSIPRLAALLALDPAVTLAWWRTCIPQFDEAEVAVALSVIREIPAFEAATTALREECTESIVGLATFKRFADRWMQERLSSPYKSKHSFGQYLSIFDSKANGVERHTAEVQFAEAVLVAGRNNAQAYRDTGASVVVLLGEEGTGKSWLTVRWWAVTHTDTAPIFIFISGRRAHLLGEQGPISPLRVLARLIADQEDRGEPARVEQWHRRFLRWSRNGPGDRPRFVIVLDGINEHPQLPWADLIAAYSKAARQLGGLLIVTSRPVFWDSRVRPRLQQDIAQYEVALGDFTSAELAAFLAHAEVDPETLSSALQQFLRNPRIASVALHLLDRLDLAPDELTRERLLLAYWQQRLEERGDLQVHSADDFKRLLASHARAWLKRPHPFPLDQWASHSGLAQREGAARVAGDMTDIAEGRFLRPVDGRPEKYTFRTEALPFALGLLLVEEIREEFDSFPNRTVDELQQFIETAIAPVSGFDDLGETFSAAVKLTLLDSAYPHQGRHALLFSLLDLQNLSHQIVDLLAPCVIMDPTFFLDWMEQGRAGGIQVHDHHSMVRVLLATRNQRRVVAALKQRVPLWLTRWSFQPRHLDGLESTSSYELERKNRCIETLEQFTRSERAYLELTTQQVPRADGVFLSRAAVILSANLPLEEIAPCLLPWAMCNMIDIEHFAAFEDMQWICLLNEHDPTALAGLLEHIIHQVVSDVNGMSPPMRGAVAVALRLSGSIEHADWAERIDPTIRYPGWRLAQKYCETDPYDPQSSKGDRLVHAVSEVQSFPSSELWACDQVTEYDSTLEKAFPALCRFEPEAVVHKLRQVLASTSTRDSAALRSLSFQLQWLAPLVDGATAGVLGLTLHRALLHLHETSSSDTKRKGWFVISQLAGVCMQHFESAEQIELLESLPPEMPLFLDLQRFLKPVPSSVLETCLRRNAPGTRKWALFAAGSAGFEVTEELRTQLTIMLNDTSPECVAMAAHAIDAAEDSALDIELLGRASASKSPFVVQGADLRLTHALSGAVYRQRNTQAVQSLDQSLLHIAASNLGRHLPDAFDMAVLELLRQYTPGPSIDQKLSKGSIGGGSYSSPKDALRRILEFPPADALAEFVRRHPHQSHEWCSRLLENGSSILWWRVGTFAMTLAGALAPHDGDLASSILRAGFSGRLHNRVTIDGAEVYLRACFADAVELHGLQEELLLKSFCDSEIEDVIRAAEVAGASKRLDAIVAAWFASAHPGRVARALAVSGLRSDIAPEIDVSVFGDVGVLHRIAQWSQRQRQRYQWMTHWLQKAASAEDPVEVWRYGTLASDLADSRFRHAWPELNVRSGTFDQFSQMLGERFSKRAERRQQKRKGTLFGLRAPAEDLRRALRV